MLETMTPYSPPATPTAAALYAQVPSYRRNGTCSLLLLVSLAAAFATPIVLGRALVTMGLGIATLIHVVLGLPLLGVCVVVLTGDVYFDQLDKDGALKKWGVANKVVAALILLGWAYSITRAFL
jgi:hypothetical protein